MADKEKMPAVIGEFSGKCCDANVFNANDMHLGEELFEKLFASEEYQRAMQNRHYIGYLGHPEDPNCMEFEHACIVMTECHMNGDGEIEGKFDLVSTPVGKVVKSFIDAGVNFGISIRGAGDVANDGEVDPDSFIFRGFDLVTFPAYSDCIPEFKEIAASQDLDKQVKTKKVYATIRANLDKITSTEALDMIEEQLREDSDIYNEVEERKNQLAEAELEAQMDATAVDESAAIIEVQEQKIDSLVQLLAEEVEDNKQLADRLAASEKEAAAFEVACSRKLDSYSRIVSTQISDMEEERTKLIQANKALSAKLNKVIASSDSKNLKYNQKIEASSRAISQKDSAIESLKAQLSETVAANEKLSKETSNLGESVEDLKSRVEAAEDMVLEYQKAYANMYANALGVHLDNISITSATTVAELQKIIKGGCNTSGMPARPSFDYEEDEVVDGEDDIDIDDEFEDDGIITM